MHVGGVWHDSFICHTHDTSRSYVTWLICSWHDSFVRDMTHLFVTWLICTWDDSSTHDMTHLYRSRDSFICDTCKMPHSCVTWLIHTSRDSFMCAPPSNNMTRCIGSLILIGHFQQKWPIFSGSFVGNNLQLRESYIWCHFAHDWAGARDIWTRYICDMSRMDVSCRIWMSHVTHKRVMSHMNVKCHIYLGMSHITRKRVMSHMNVLRQISHSGDLIFMCEMSHVSFIYVWNESCHIWTCYVRYQISWVSHVTHK